MTLPLGPDNIDLGGWPFLISAAGNGDTSIADLDSHDQDTILERFKEKFIGTMGSGTSVFTRSTGPLASVWSGLRRQPGLPMPVAILEAFLQRVFGTSTLWSSMASLLDDAETFWGRFQSFWGGVDFTESGWNLGDALDQFIDTSITPRGRLAELVDGRLSDIQSPNSLLDTWQQFRNALRGRPDSSPATAADSAAEIADLAATTAALSAAVAALGANQDGSANSGLVGGDDLERVAPTDLGGSSYWVENVIEGSAGGMAIPGGHDAEWLHSGTSGREIEYHTGVAAHVETVTDYQKFTLVIGQQTPEVGNTSGQFAHLKIKVRENAAGTQYVFVRLRGPGLFTASKVQFGYRNGGSEVLVGSDADMTQSVGARLSVESGTFGGVRIYRLLKNDAVILTWPDIGALSAVGASNRRWSWSARAGGSFSGTQVAPASVARIIIVDNVPAPVVGSGLEVYRANTGSVSVSNGDQQIPNSFFDTVVARSPDITWSASTSTATISKTGWYHITVGLSSTATIGATGYGMAAIFVNGTIRKYGNSVNTTSTGSISSDQHYLASATLYLTAGDTIRAGSYRSGLSHSFVGDTAGAKSYFSVAKLTPAA